MMSRNSENNYHSNNTANKYFDSDHIIQSDLYVPSLMHKKPDGRGTKNIRNEFSNRSGGKSDGYYQLNSFFNDNLHKLNLTETFCECRFRQCKGLNKCTLCGRTEELLSSTYKHENIYENICEECGLIYSADKCEHCAKKVTYGSLRKNKQLNIFSGILDNIRLKKKSKNKKKSPTIEIIHNVDGVFKTNKTFDLNEISRLKLKQSSENHVYGKLRKSEECLSSSFKQRTDFRLFGSDSNFPQHITPQSDLLSQNKSHNIELNNSPIYENLKTFIYSTVSPAFNDITDNSLIYWLTSLKRHTTDYNEETIYNVKCIPSNSFSTCCNYRRSYGIFKSESKSDFIIDKVEDFKICLMENQSKRKAIYFKEEKQFEPILVVIKENNYLFESSSQQVQSNACDSFINVNDQQHVNDESGAADYSFLRPKNFQFQRSLVDIIEKPCTQQLIPVICETTALLPYHIPNIPKKLKITKANVLSLNRLIFSIALNRIVITYDCDFMTFINYLSRIRKNNKFIKSTDYNTVENRQKYSKWKRRKISDFEKPIQCHSEFVKKEFNDFEIKAQPTDYSHRHIEDFEKLKPSNQPLKKQLSDFELKPKENISPSLPVTEWHAIEYTNTMESKPIAIANCSETEDIYQPIWKFQTIGYAKENYLPDVCYESQINDGTDDISEWEVDDEFAYSTNLCVENYDNSVHNLDQYQSVCILYNLNEPKLNQLIYETDHEFGYNDYKNKCTQLSPIAEEDGFYFERKLKPTKNSLFPLPSSVQAWKIMLWNVNYIEDEEDLNIPESYFLDRVLKNQQSESHIASTPIDITKASNGQNSPIITPTKKEIGFLDKFQSGRIDIAKNFSTDSRDEGVHCVSYKKNSEIIEIMEVKKVPSHLVYGVSIEEVEKDDKHPNVPKFVIECIAIIEKEENLITNGIYRASGKKESIDKIKKKMNETKPKKGSKYSVLKDEDVHTVTGSLKQFFREMKTDLIPINIFRNLPGNFETEDSLKIIAKEINGIPSDSKLTLKYLLKHLVKVDANSQHNLMTASNLSIVWGACLFTSSVTFNDTFETSELIRKNNLIKILIQRYNDIFPGENSRTS